MADENERFQNQKRFDEIIGRVRNGDADAVEQLYQHMLPTMLTYTQTRLKERSGLKLHPEDVCRDAWMSRVIPKISKAREKPNLAPQVLAMFSNGIVDIVQDAKRRYDVQREAEPLSKPDREMLESIYNDNAETFRKALATGANPNLVVGEAPISAHVAMQGNPVFMRELLAAAQGLGTGRLKGRTLALTMVARFGRAAAAAEMAALLVEAGTNVTLVSGETVLDLAIRSGSEPVAFRLDELRVPCGHGNRELLCRMRDQSSLRTRQTGG